MTSRERGHRRVRWKVWFSGPRDALEKFLHTTLSHVCRYVQGNILTTPVSTQKSILFVYIYTKYVATQGKIKNWCPVGIQMEECEAFLGDKLFVNALSKHQQHTPSRDLVKIHIYPMHDMASVKNILDPITTSDLLYVLKERAMKGDEDLEDFLEIFQRRSENEALKILKVMTLVI